MLTKEEDLLGSRVIEISRYDDGSFASARERVRISVLDDGKPIGDPVTEWRSLDQATLVAMLGEAAVLQRAHVDRVEGKIAEERASAEAEKAALVAALSEKDAALVELRSAAVKQ